jgi:hypothetical protein
MTVELERVLGQGPLGGRSFAERARELTAAQRACYRGVLAAFRDGRQPVEAPAGQASARLVELDLIQLDGEGRVAVAYPFSAGPTRHRVILKGGREFNAMCAIDALGIPYMLHQPGEVLAHEPDRTDVVRVVVDPAGAPAWMPASAVALIAHGEGCCLAQSACPHINLFASKDAATSYLTGRALDGELLPIAKAADTARWLFGDLLDGLADD